MRSVFPLLCCVLVALVPSSALGAAETPAPQPTEIQHVPWSRSAVLYEVNIRQYTPEGTLQAFEQHLPELKAMGVDILWLMPVTPIGIQDRKGVLGSYYAVRDYQAVNPEFGTLDDLKAVVAHAHALGMKVILDWVANHTAMDHPWTLTHPEWYQKDKQGEIVSYRYNNGTSIEEWSDVAGLDYRSPGLRAAMISAMQFWVREADIDGFRCDVAMRVPTSFWEEARAALDRQKPMFMLAEAEKPELEVRAFDMGYTWELHKVLVAIAAGKATREDLVRRLEADRAAFPIDSYPMLYTSNHDHNSWEGSDAELYGPAHDAFTVLSFTLPGMPLIYSGQEMRNTHRIKFFKRDPISWKERERVPLYTRLAALKHAHPALAAGTAGGALEVLAVEDPKVFAFRRVKGRDVVSISVNFSAEPRMVRIPGAEPKVLEPWGYLIREAN
jgi:glycosidase